MPAARIQSGQQALFNGDWDMAINEFSTAQENSNDADIQAAALLGIGRTKLMAENYQEAVDEFQTLIQDYPQLPNLARVYFFMAQAYSGLERYSDAAEAYLQYMTLSPGIIDGYVLDLRGDALFAAGDYAGAANDYQAALLTPSLNDPILSQMKLARATSLSGDYDSALRLYDDVLTRTNNDYTLALVDLRKGQIYTALGQMDQAYQVYQDAVNNYPTSYDSYSALLALVEAGVPVDELNRGIVDYYAGQYGVATAAFDRYLQNSPADPAAAYYYYGLANRALGGYLAAVADWDKVIANYPESRFWDDAWEQKAYTQWNYLNQYTVAVETLLNFVSISPSHPRAAEFLFDAAQVAERADKLDQAAALWDRVASEYPSYEQAQRALFLAGISRYRLENYSAALESFQRALDTATNLSGRSAADLWIGKSQNALGDIETARATWEQTAAIDPTGYYSERALDILRDRPPFTPPQTYDLVVDLQDERQQAEEWLRTTFSLPADTDLSGLGSLADDGYLKRGTELWKLGMDEDARAEFEQLRSSVQSDPVASYRLANYLAQLGLYRPAIMAARQVLNLAGMDDATTMNAPPYFNHLRFGTYFSDLIITNAQKYGFDPLFLFSVVRQESLFESFVQSSAAASGLMQIIPTTGADIARNLGWPADYTNNDLYRPLVNIALGTDYLDTQRNAFDGDLYAALAAYNGGPGNAHQWKNLAPNDPDLFLEVIRYSETRNYIRGIYEIFNIYRRIYDRTP